MINFKKKILAGLLSGALLLTGSAAFANPPERPPEMDKAWQEEAEKNIDGWAKHLSEKYGVDAAQVKKALTDGVHVNDVHIASVLSKLSGKSFSDVLAMKVDWFQVADKLGVTRDQVKNFFEQERNEHFAKNAGIDVKTLKSLLDEGYDLHDIDIAGRIAKEAGKDIKTVLKKRTINNTWEDVAKSFNVDMKKIMPPPPPGHHGQGRPHRAQ